MKLAGWLLWSILFALDVPAMAKDLLVEESMFSQRLRLAVELSKARTHQSPTNMEQLIPMLNSKYWAEAEETFLSFGRRSGFATSIFEKYVFMPSSATLRISSGHRVTVMLMSALPFSANGLTRRGIVYLADGLVGEAIVNEQEIQEMLSRESIQVPRPPPMLRAVEMDRSRRLKQEEFNAAVEHGIEPFRQRNQLLTVFGYTFAAALAGFGVVVVWRRASRRNKL